MVLIIAIIVNATVYSYIAIMKYVAMNSSVYDLGVSSQLLYYVFHSNLSYDLTHITFNKLIYLPLAVIYLVYPHPQTVLVLQAFIMSAGSYPVYLIARLKFKNDRTAFMGGLTYLLFYPLYGPLWFDFHFMALFPTPFLFSFYFYLNGEKRKSLVFGIIASITDLLAPVIVGFLGVYVIVSNRYKNGQNGHIDLNGTGFLLLLSSVVIFVAANLYIGPSYAVSFANNSVFSSTFAFTHTTGLYEAEFFLWLMLPMLFICIFAPEILFLIVPFAVLAFANSYFPFVDTMFYQYTSLVVAQIFIAFIFGAERLGKKYGRHGITVKRIVAVVLAFNIFLAALFTPLGAVGTGGISDHSLNYALTGNQNSYPTMVTIAYHQYDSGVMKLSSMVPEYSSIIIQDNMPQLTAGYHWALPDFYPEMKNPEFVITYPYSPAFYSTYFALDMNYTMLNETNNVFMPNHYGIVGEDYGEILLERGYTGPVRQFIPMNETIHYSALTQNSNAGKRSESIVYRTAFLAPGDYEIKSSDSRINTTDTQLIITFNNFNGTAALPMPSMNVSLNGTLTVMIHVPNYMMNVEFTLSNHGNGTVPSSLQLVQKTPGQ